VDGKPALPALGSSRFGEYLLELPLPGGWGLAAAFSPDGSCLAVASQGSQLTLLSGTDLQDFASLAAFAPTAAAEAAAGAEGAEGCRVQHLQLPGLPLKCLAFLSGSLLVGGGFDCQPQLFTRGASGSWEYACSLSGERCA